LRRRAAERLAVRAVKIFAAVLLCAVPASAQTSWFQPSLLERPEVKRAIQSVDDRSSAIVDEWVKLVEIPAPSKKEQARAQYIRTEMQKLGLTDIRIDDMSNVSGVRKGSGGGPSVVLCAHMDTVFPDGTDLKVKRDGDILRAPGIGDDTSNLMAVLETFRALDRGGVKTKGDLIFLASVQEELGLLGAKHWLETSGYKPDMFVAVDVSATRSGAARCELRSSSSFTPHPARTRWKAAAARGRRKLSRRRSTPSTPSRCRRLPKGSTRSSFRSRTSACSAAERSSTPFRARAWFTVDLRSLDTATLRRLEQAVDAAARGAADSERVRFRMKKSVLVDYSKARPKDDRLNDPLVQTALAVKNHFRPAGTPAIVPADVGSTDANNAIAMGIPAVAIGATLEYTPHRLEETAKAGSIVPGVKSLIALAVALTTH
jgi:acetylornithine deacetylase/succinyl-diaminopimelate desuccinylase-like protein